MVADEIVHELVVDALVHNDSVDTFEEVVIVVDLTGRIWGGEEEAGITIGLF